MQDLEEWKVIEEFPDYEVSNLGRVRSWKSGEPKLLSLKLNKHTGYYLVCLTQNGYHYKTVHSLIAIAFLGKPRGTIGTKSGNWQVNHRNLDKRDNRVDNLEWVKRLRNTEHAAENGVYVKRMSRQQVAEIKYLLAQDWSVPQIAKRYDIDPTVVYQIRDGRSYRYIKPANEIEEKPEKPKRKKPCDYKILSFKQVHEIKALLAEGISVAAIAKQFGINYAVVRNIKLGRTYRTL